MVEFCEIVMIVLFGVSWPVNVLKSYKARTTKGKSILFLALIFAGYISGITGKLISGDFKWYVLFFYILNTVMVLIDIGLYFRNLSLDRRAK
jgi:hypothetical protein